MKIKEKIKLGLQKVKADVKAVYLIFLDKETPKLPKILACIVIAYALSPIDLIPDFIPILGYLDDLLILSLLIMWIIKLIPKEKFEEYRNKSANVWENGKPKKWYFAIPIIVIWAIIIWLIFSKLILK